MEISSFIILVGRLTGLSVAHTLLGRVLLPCCLIEGAGYSFGHYYRADDHDPAPDSWRLQLQLALGMYPVPANRSF